MSLEGEEEPTLQVRNTALKVLTGSVIMINNGKRTLAEYVQNHGLPELCPKAMCGSYCAGVWEDGAVLGF